MQKLLDSYRLSKGLQIQSEQVKEPINFKHEVFIITNHYSNNNNTADENEKPQRKLSQIEIELKVRYHVRRLKIARRQLMLKSKQKWTLLFIDL